MKIGINASFLRKPGTGIGQVTFNFLEKLKEAQISNSEIQNIGSKFNPPTGGQNSKFVLYVEEPVVLNLPANFEVKNFLPRWWKRDDLIRKMLWEREVAKRAVADGCDVFISLYQSSTNFHTSCLMPHTSSVRHIMVVHDIIPRLFPEYRGNMRQAFHWKLVERAIRSADHIVTVSQHTKNDLMRELALSDDEISVAYPDVSLRFREAVSDEDISRVLKKYGLERGYIYHGGGLEVRKNAEKLLRAYKQLTVNREQSTENGEQQADIPKLVISGKIFDSSNKLATDMEGLVESLELEDKVKLLGFVPDEDLPALYRGALFFVYPSLYEGFGLPVLEALRMQVPVLASRASSIPEVGGEAALYCDPESVESIAAGMKQLFYDEALRQTLISKSAPQAVQFSWENFVEKVFAVLKA